MAEVQYVGASRIYPGNPVPAVNHLDLDITDGEFMVLVGPSGSGKSTALRMLAGLEDVDEGEIRISGKDVSNKPPKDRDIAMVFQNYALYPHMTVADNMGFALRNAGMSKEDTRSRVEGGGARRPRRGARPPGHRPVRARQSRLGHSPVVHPLLCGRMSPGSHHRWWVLCQRRRY